MATVASIPAKRLKIKLGCRMLGYVNLKQPLPILEDSVHRRSLPSAGDSIEESSVKGSRKRGRSGSAGEDEPKKRQKTMKDRSMRCLCSDLLRTLMEHQYGWAFCRPVNSEALNLPDYARFISRPMDLGTIKSRLEKQEYVGVEDFGRDIRLTFSNAMMYTLTSSEIHRMAAALLEIFEARWNLIVRGRRNQSPKSEKAESVLESRTSESSGTSGDESQKAESQSTEDKKVTEQNLTNSRGTTLLNSRMNESSVSSRAEVSSDYTEEKKMRNLSDSYTNKSSCEDESCKTKNATTRTEILKSRFKDTIAKAQRILGFIERPSKRDLQREREALQLALKKMEDTADGGDNLQYQKELERLCGPALHTRVLEQFGLLLDVGT